MANIIAARFETQVHADAALAALRAAGVSESDAASFYLNPPGQHSQYPIGGDAHHDEGTRESGKTAVAGGAIGGAAGVAVGAAAGAALEPGFTAAAAIAGAGVGAYVGSLAGGLKGARAGHPEEASLKEPVEREAGIMVAARADAGTEAMIIQVLRAQGAHDIERAEGEWRDGGWIDFDPRRTPHLIES